MQVITRAAPDILVLQGIDWDAEGAALAALADRLVQAGQTYPYRYAGRPNTGQRTGLDHDGDGRTDGPRDTQGYGRFTGEGGMAVLSRLPIGQVADLSGLLWADLPGADLPRNDDGTLFPAPDLYAVQRLSTTAHWALPIDLPSGGTLTLLTWHASPPVFDGPEDMNGRRNADETRLWQRLLDSALETPPPTGPFVILGDANLDPIDGDGRGEALRALLSDPRLQDPAPRSEGGSTAADPDHRGNPALDTAAWEGPGNLRVDYVLPSAGISVAGSGVLWPRPDDPFYETVASASRHRLVWVDIALP